MQSIPLSEFRANAAAMIDLVERGESVRILRHGKPVAFYSDKQIGRASCRERVSSPV